MKIKFTAGNGKELKMKQYKVHYEKTIISSRTGKKLRTYRPICNVGGQQHVTQNIEEVTCQKCLAKLQNNK